MNIIQDAEQRKKALDPTQSYIVQAPAGSGKTEILMRRFLVLLTCVKQPEEILAITFTKKSAAEMRIRILNALTQAHSGQEPEDEHRRQTWQLAKRVIEHDQKLKWHLLENPNRLKIQTMDSFNAYLTRQLPLLSRFGGTPDISDQAHSLYHSAVNELFNSLNENSEWAYATKELLLYLDNDLNAVQGLLVTMLSKRDQWLPYISLDIHDPYLREILESHLSAITSDLLQQLANSFPKEKITELCVLANFAAQNLLREQSESLITLCDGLCALPKYTLSDKKIWLGIAKLLLTDEGEWRKRFDKNIGFPAETSSKNNAEKMVFRTFKARMLQFIDQLKACASLKTYLNELLILPASSYEDPQWQILQSLILVLKISVAQLKLIFQQQGKIDYIENAESALFALGTEENPTNITLSLDYQIRHILIDEFQDTSSSQYQLIEKLTMGWEAQDGRTLFVVGDPMQSIYRFREAEVGLFIRARKEGIGSILLNPLTLTVNFRSNANIVTWVNEHFVNVLPAYDDISTGAVSYTKSHAYHQYESGVVHLHNEERQAQKIVEIIQQRKKICPCEQIAILVRSRSHVIEIIPALRHAGIAYRAIEIDPLNSRPMIQDLMILTKVLLYPTDRVAMLSLLRAPWCGLTLHDLLLLTGSKPLKTLWEQLHDPTVLSSLSEDGQKRLQRILPILKLKIAERSRYPLRIWIESTWILLGGPATLTASADLVDMEAFFNLLEKIEHNGDLISFSQLEDGINTLYASPNSEANDSVQIMTIHNAKGLEFDTVILPHLEKKSAQDDKQLLLWMDIPRGKKQNSLILAPIPAIGQDDHSATYHYVKQKIQEKNNFEMGRLLYVAVTRAKCELHLVFSLNTSGSDSIKPEGKSLLAKLWPAIKNESSFPIHLEYNEIAIPEAKETFINRLSLNWTNPIKEKPIPPSTNHDTKNGFLLPDYSAAHIGTAIHLILQHICKQGIFWWEHHTTVAKTHFLENYFLELNLLETEIPKAIQRVFTTIEHILSDPRGQWIIFPHLDAEVEFKITAKIADKIYSFSIDRTFVEENTRWIIDYKTADYTGHDIQSFLENEQKKYQEQLKNYALAFANIDKRPIRLGLYFPMLKAWQEVSMN